MKHYIIVMEGGTEISSEGPFPTEEQRNEAARAIWRDMNPHACDNIFRAQVDEKGELSVGVFIDGELE